MKSDQAQLESIAATVSAIPPGHEGIFGVTADQRPTLEFTRSLRHAPAAVWRALTDPAEAIGWLGSLSIDGRPGGHYDIRLDGKDPTGGAVSTYLITEWQAERVLECQASTPEAEPSQQHLLRWEIEPNPDGCTLRFTCTFGQSERPPNSIVAGWHGKLDELIATAGGQPTDWSTWTAESITALYWHYRNRGNAADTPALPDVPAEQFGAMSQNPDGRWSLTFQRTLPGNAQALFDCLTDADAGFWDVRGDRHVGGSIEIEFGTTRKEHRILAWQAPNLLEYEGASEQDQRRTHRSRWSIAEGSAGECQLEMVYQLADEVVVPIEIAVGWHMSLDRLGAVMAGVAPSTAPVERATMQAVSLGYASRGARQC